MYRQWKIIHNHYWDGKLHRLKNFLFLKCWRRKDLFKLFRKSIFFPTKLCPICYLWTNVGYFRNYIPKENFNNMIKNHSHEISFKNMRKADRLLAQFLSRWKKRRKHLNAPVFFIKFFSNFIVKHLVGVSPLYNREKTMWDSDIFESRFLLWLKATHFCNLSYTFIFA